MSTSNTNDRELLELAARAAGLRVLAAHERPDGAWMETEDGFWNPLLNDGDALRLAVKLGISPVWYSLSVDALAVGLVHVTVMSKDEPDPVAATRRAITRAAAATIGRTAPAGG